MRKFYSMDNSNGVAAINIYTDIAPYTEGSIECLSKQIDGLKDAKQIDVFINSNGGDVFEGLAIYHALKRSKAKVVTHCDGMAASIASVIFMAGEERIMPKSSFLMIHNAWGYGVGNAEELRKYADDLETVTQASVGIYKDNSSLSEEEIKALMDNETILTAEEALEYGFATRLEDDEKDGTRQSGAKWLCEIIKKYRAELRDQDEEEETPPDGEEEETVEENEGEETPETDSDNPENPPDETGEETPPDGEEKPEEEDEEETEDNSTDETAAQKWCGLFNALKNF